MKLAFIVLVCLLFSSCGTELTVLSYNIRHGADMKYEMNLQGQADFLKRHNADLLSMQEVDVLVKRSENIDEPAFFSKELGLDNDK